MLGKTILQEDFFLCRFQPFITHKLVYILQTTPFVLYLVWIGFLRFSLIRSWLRRCMIWWGRWCRRGGNATTTSKWRCYHYSLSFSQVEVGNRRAPFQLVCHVILPITRMRQCAQTKDHGIAWQRNTRSTLVQLLPIGEICFCIYRFLQLLLYTWKARLNNKKIYLGQHISKTLTKKTFCPPLLPFWHIIHFTSSQAIGVVSFYSKPVKFIRSQHVSSWGEAPLRSDKREPPKIQLCG